jgi:hypothetical protein
MYPLWWPFWWSSRCGGTYRFVAFIKATKLRHRASTRPDSINWTHPTPVVSLISSWKGLELTCWPLIKIGVWHIKLMRSI